MAKSELVFGKVGNGGGDIDLDFLNNITAISQTDLTNFIVGKTYFLAYTRGTGAEHKLTSGGEVISSYTSKSGYGMGMFIFKATSTTVTVAGSSNTCYVAQLD